MKFGKRFCTIFILKSGPLNNAFLKKYRKVFAPLVTTENDTFFHTKIDKFRVRSVKLHVNKISEFLQYIEDLHLFLTEMKKVKNDKIDCGLIYA